MVRTPENRYIEKRFESHVLPTGTPDLDAARGIVRAVMMGEEGAAGFRIVEDILRMTMANGGYGGEVAAYYDYEKDECTYFLSDGAKERIYE